MHSKPVFNFTIEKENHTIHITGEFDANLELVWKAWTTAELLDQWCAPKPLQTSKQMVCIQLLRPLKIKAEHGEKIYSDSPIEDLLKQSI